MRVRRLRVRSSARNIAAEVTQLFTDCVPFSCNEEQAPADGDVGFGLTRSAPNAYSGASEQIAAADARRFGVR